MFDTVFFPEPAMVYPYYTAQWIDSGSVYGYRLKGSRAYSTALPNARRKTNSDPTWFG